MVDLVEIQAAYYMVAATGVLVAAVYYVYNMRINRKAMRTSLETRQIQLLLEFNQVVSKDIFGNMKLYQGVMKAKWDSFDDYLVKNMRNPEVSTYREVLFRRYHVTGLMIRDGLITIDTFVEYISDAPVMVWEKYKDIIMEYRKRYHLPSYLRGFEYLAGEINKYRVRMGWGVKTPDDITYPSPDEVNS